MERYLKIATVNLKTNLFPHILVVMLMILSAPLLMGMHYLDQLQVVKIIDQYFSLAGIFLFMPVFMPDMNKDIRDVTASKKESMVVLHSIRCVESLVFVTLSGAAFLLYLRMGSCVFSFTQLLYAFLANAIFLGGVGILVFSVTDNVAFAYMIPMLYYVSCYGAIKQYVGKFYLFTIQSGSCVEKMYLLCMGLLCIILAVVIRDCRFICKPVRIVNRTGI